MNEFKEERFSEYKDCIISKSKLVIGISLGVGYLTILPYIPFIILFLIMKPATEGEQELLAFTAQIITGIIIAVIMGYLIGRNLKTIIKDTFKDTTIAYSFALFVSMYLFVVIWNFISIEILKIEPTSANQDQINLMFTEMPVIAVFFIALLAPVLEELIFRYFLFNGLKFMGEVLAILMTTFFFAFIHLIPSFFAGTVLNDLLLFPVYLVPSFMLTLVYFKTKKIAIPILAHIAFNGIQVLFMILYTYTDFFSDVISSSSAIINSIFF